MEFRVLGPLEADDGDGTLELGGARQQVVLAVLLLSVGKVMATARLADAVYGQDPPPTARSQVQISVSSLRRLFASRYQAPVISTRAQGYVIELGDARLDSVEFEKLVAAARTARRAGQLDLAVACYRDALRLWRGPAFHGIDSQLIRVAASRLDEQHISAVEDRVELELELGRHHELIGELTELVEEHPLREQLRGQLMLALYRCGRAAEALTVYRQTRRILIEELGIEPGARLQQLQHAVLTGDPGLGLAAQPVLAVPPRPRVPGLLPTDIADFTGREQELDRIRRCLADGVGEGKRHAVPVVVITGKGGVGKTSIAVHAAHEAAGQFPDGQLFADLHGGSLHPVGPLQVLERFIRALGTPVTFVPEGLDERAEMYRNLLAGRRVLIVLDDAVSESQVTPLLPGGGATVIITSRRRLASLAGASHVEVRVLNPGKSLDLLARIAGERRVHAEAQAAAEIAEYCGYLPLALRIAGSRLSARPHWSLQQLSERLADETCRLDELTHGDMGVRLSISLSYASAGPGARQLFRRLAVLDLPMFSGWMSAALLDLPLAQAEDLLDDLVNAQLIEITGTESGVRSHYRFHDLIRVFAREQAAASEPVAERRAALQRVLGALLYLAREAQNRYYGGPCFVLHSDARSWPLPARLVDALLADPLEWYDNERAVLVAGIRQAAQAGAVDLCWSLAVSGVTLFQSRTYLDDWRETHEIALEAAQKAGNVRGQAAMLYSIGSLHIAQQRFDQAGRVLAEAGQLFAGIGDDQGAALVTRYVAYLDSLSGWPEQAAAGYKQALAIFSRTEDKVAAAYALNGLAQVKLGQGDTSAARELLADALRLSRESQCRRMEAQVLYRIGEVSLQSRDLAQSLRAFEAALAMSRDIGDLIGEAYVLIGSGTARTRLGDFLPAGDALQRALELASAVGQPLTEARAVLGLSELALASGNPAQAVAYAQQASQVFRGLGAQRDDAPARALLSRARAALNHGEHVRLAVLPVAGGAVMIESIVAAGSLSGRVGELGASRPSWADKESAGSSMVPRYVE